MRKITEQARDAFFGNYAFNKSNMCVAVEDREVCMYLHGNKIAKKNELGTFINNCGWDTPTTKERLNSLLDGREAINQKNFQWYFTDKTGKVSDFPLDTWVQIAD